MNSEQGYLLIVEDDSDIRRMLDATLTMKGYRVMTAPNGRDGLDIIHKEFPSIIIADIMMPTLDGFGLVHRLRINPDTRHIPVVFITGVMLVAALVSLSALWMARRWSWACRFAAVGLGFQSAFIVIRAASFHHVDQLLRIQLAAIKMNLLLESVGLLLVLLAAMTAWARERSCE